MSETLNFKLVFDSSELRPAEIERSMLSFEREIADLDVVQKKSGSPTDKEIDPLMFAALSVSLAPTVTTKFFEFLNAWAMRRESRTIKVKIQTGKNKIIEFEASETLSEEKIKSWISTIEAALKKK